MFQSLIWFLNGYIKYKLYYKISVGWLIRPWQGSWDNPGRYTAFKVSHESRHKNGEILIQASVKERDEHADELIVVTVTYIYLVGNLIFRLQIRLARKFLRILYRSKSHGSRAPITGWTAVLTRQSSNAAKWRFIYILDENKSHVCLTARGGLLT